MSFLSAAILALLLGTVVNNAAACTQFTTNTATGTGSACGYCSGTMNMNNYCTLDYNTCVYGDTDIRAAFKERCPDLSACALFDLPHISDTSCVVDADYCPTCNDVTTATCADGCSTVADDPVVEYCCEAGTPSQVAVSAIGGANACLAECGCKARSIDYAATTHCACEERCVAGLGAPTCANPASSNAFDTTTNYCCGDTDAAGPFATLAECCTAECACHNGLTADTSFASGNCCENTCTAAGDCLGGADAPHGFCCATTTGAGGSSGGTVTTTAQIGVSSADCCAMRCQCGDEGTLSACSCAEECAALEPSLADDGLEYCCYDNAQAAVLSPTYGYCAAKCTCELGFAECPTTVIPLTCAETCAAAGADACFTVANNNVATTTAPEEGYCCTTGTSPDISTAFLGDASSDCCAKKCACDEHSGTLGECPCATACASTYAELNANGHEYCCYDSDQNAITGTTYTYCGAQCACVDAAAGTSFAQCPTTVDPETTAVDPDPEPTCVQTCVASGSENCARTSTSAGGNWAFTAGEFCCDGTTETVSTLADCCDRDCGECTEFAPGDCCGNGCESGACLTAVNDGVATVYAPTHGFCCETTTGTAPDMTVTATEYFGDSEHDCCSMKCECVGAGQSLVGCSCAEQCQGAEADLAADGLDYCCYADSTAAAFLTTDVYSYCAAKCACAHGFGECPTACETECAGGGDCLTTDTNVMDPEFGFCCARTVEATGSAAAVTTVANSDSDHCCTAKCDCDEAGGALVACSCAQHCADSGLDDGLSYCCSTDSDTTTTYTFCEKKCGECAAADGFTVCANNVANPSPPPTDPPTDPPTLRRCADIFDTCKTYYYFAMYVYQASTANGVYYNDAEDTTTDGTGAISTSTDCDACCAIGEAAEASTADDGTVAVSDTDSFFCLRERADFLTHAVEIEDCMRCLCDGIIAGHPTPLTGKVCRFASSKTGNACAAAGFGATGDARARVGFSVLSFVLVLALAVYVY